MGVYIKGLKMPPSGQYVFVLTSSGMVENVNGLIVGEAVEVETPHGRLIDADAVTREMLADIGKRSIRIDTAITVLEAEGKDDG